MDNKLAVFRAVAQHGNLSAAAETLNMTQSAVSKIVRQLEEAYAARLFDRLPRGVALTEFGAVLLEHAKTVESSDHAARVRMQALMGGSVHLRLGAGAGWGLSILPDTVTDLRRRFPSYRAEMLVGTREMLLPMLASGDLDIAITQGDEFEHPDIEKHSLGVVPIYTVCHREHPLHEQRHDDADALGAYEWVNFRSVSSLTDLPGQIWPPSIPPGARIAFTTGSWTLGIQIVANSHLLMGIPRGLLPLAAKFDVHPLPELPATTSLAGYIWIRKAIGHLPIVRDFMELLKEKFAEETLPADATA